MSTVPGLEFENMVAAIERANDTKLSALIVMAVDPRGRPGLMGGVLHEGRWLRYSGDECHELHVDIAHWDEEGGFWSYDH